MLGNAQTARPLPSIIKRTVQLESKKCKLGRQGGEEIRENGVESGPDQALGLKEVSTGLQKESWVLASAQAC